MSYRTARSALAVALLIMGASSSRPLSAQPATPSAAVPASGDRLAAAVEQGRARFQRAFLEHGLAGLSVAVAVDGEVVWADGFGWADVENRVAMWPDTKQRIGSVSKPLTAIALGLLVERGKIDLDAPVQRYVPAFPAKEHPITVRQVAGHVAGIRHYRGAEFLSDRRFETVAESLSVFADDPLLFEPGTRYNYSSYGWNLISAVIEGASGEPFLDFMEREVLRPLGLADTTADRNAELIERRTRFYDRDSGRLLHGPHVTAFVVLPEDGVVAAAISNTSGVANLGRNLHLLAATMAVEVAEAVADRPRRANAAR